MLLHVWLCLIFPTTREVSAVVTSFLDTETELKRGVTFHQGICMPVSLTVRLGFSTLSQTKARVRVCGVSHCPLGRASLLLLSPGSVQAFLSQGTCPESLGWFRVGLLCHCPAYAHLHLGFWLLLLCTRSLNLCLLPQSLWALILRGRLAGTR